MVGKITKNQDIPIIEMSLIVIMLWLFLRFHKCLATFNLTLCECETVCG